MRTSYFFAVHIIITIVVLTMVSGLCLALDPDRAVTQYVIDTWTDEDGLPTNTIRAVLHTRDGYIWLGTEEGLVRFDGTKFTVFDDGNTPEMTGNYIFALYQDSAERIWIGTVGGGLLVYEKGNFKRYSAQEGITSNNIQCVLETSDKKIWVGSDGDGLYCINDGNVQQYTRKNGLVNENVNCLFEDRKGNLWIGTKNGISVFKGGGFTNYGLGEKKDEVSIKSFFIDKNFNFWISSYEGLYRFENGRFVFQKLGIPGIENSMDKIRLNQVLEDRDGNVWFCAPQHGLIRYRDNRFHLLTKNHGLADNSVVALAEDREGSLWVGTGVSGLNRLREGKFLTISAKEGMSNDVVFPIISDKNGYLWIGTHDGLNRYNPANKTWISVKKENGLSHNGIYTLYEDRNGRIWVGTDDGLNLLDTSRPGKVRVEKKYLDKHYIPSIYVDSDNTVWVGTFKGLKRKKAGAEVFERITDKDGKPASVVNFMKEDRNGHLWLSDLRKGMVKFDGKNYRRIDHKSGLAGNTVLSMLEDKNGILWFGTNKGLTRYDGKTFMSYTKKEGLHNNNIYQVFEDDSGFLWMSCNKGLFKVMKKELTDLALGKMYKVRSIVYRKHDGMPTSECNGGYQPAGCKTPDGRMWFPTSKGVVIVDPANMNLNELSPPVYVERVLLDGVPADISKEVELEPRVKRLEINFTALSFLNPRSVQFRYKLDGFDNGWIDPGKRRAAWYTNLDGGSYSFKVIASNNDGVWNKKGAAIDITVIPPFWATWWFRILALLVFAVVSYTVIHLTMKIITISAFWKKKKYIDKFKLLDIIGSGGMGTIYKAQNTTDKSETVALKVLREDMFTDSAIRKRFKQEAAIIDQLDHPHIVKVLERGHSKQHLYISMELLEGQTLTDKIRKDKRLRLEDAFHILDQTADALTKIHGKNIIHRDMKPDNIMLITRGTDNNYVKLLDFGLAKMEHQTRLTQTGMVMGTLSYISPEQVSGAGAYPASDVYALGVIFFEMVTGEKPFVGPTTIDVMKLILDKEPIQPIRYRPEIGQPVNDLILKMMAKSPDERLSISDVRNRLAEIKRVMIR